MPDQGNDIVDLLKKEPGELYVWKFYLKNVK